MKNVFLYSLIFLISLSCKQNTTSIKKGIASATKEAKLSSSYSIPRTETSFRDCPKTEIELYLDDTKDFIITIHKNPNGKVIQKLIKDNDNFGYMFRVTEAKNGWFRIISPIFGVENDFDIPNDQGWIHGSMLSVDTRNYSGERIKLLEKPNNGKTVVTFNTDIIGLRVKDICGNWVKVEYKTYVGWIESKWLCGNILTSCS